MPQVARAQTITWKYQSTWPSRDIFHEMAVGYAKRVHDLTGGRFRLDVLAAGTVVPAFQTQDAVHTGILDASHGVTAYWYGKHRAFSLFGTPPSFGWDAHGLLGWFYHGGGEALYNELVSEILKLQIVGFLYFPMPTQPLGWFRKPVSGPLELRNLKYRTAGLSAELSKELGAAVTMLPSGEIVPAMDRGILDAAEFNNPSSDLALGFPDVAKAYAMQSHHQPAESFEIIFNGRSSTRCRASSRPACATPRSHRRRISSEWHMTAIPRPWRRSSGAACRSSRRRTQCSRPSFRLGTRLLPRSRKMPSSGR
jgi:TRAP-type mannitol/chloroaromatic compound transport system substrate-binding protein